MIYPGMPFSPQTTLTGTIGAADTIIPVADVGVFPAAPNYATIGTDEDGETILYTAKTATSLSGCTRGVEGTAKTWGAGDVIARNFTAKDQENIADDISAAQTTATNAGTAAAAAQSTADGAVSDAAAAQSAAGAAQATANTAQETANAAVPQTRKINNKLLSSDINLTASDVGASGKAVIFSVVLASNGWSSNSQTVSSAGFLTGDYAYTVTADPSSEDVYMACGVRPATNDITTDGQLTFSCSTVPSSNLTVNIQRAEATTL